MPSASHEHSASVSGDDDEEVIALKSPSKYSKSPTGSVRSYQGESKDGKWKCFHTHTFPLFHSHSISESDLSSLYTTLFSLLSSKPRVNVSNYKFLMHTMFSFINWHMVRVIAWRWNFFLNRCTLFIYNNTLSWCIIISSFFLSLTLILYRYKVFKLEPQVLIEGVLFRARYLGSTQLICEGQPTKTTRMMQAEEAVARIKVSEHIELESVFHRFSLIFSRKLSICLSWILNMLSENQALVS